LELGGRQTEHIREFPELLQVRDFFQRPVEQLMLFAPETLYEQAKSSEAAQPGDGADRLRRLLIARSLARVYCRRSAAVIRRAEDEGRVREIAPVLGDVGRRLSRIPTTRSMYAHTHGYQSGDQAG